MAKTIAVVNQKGGVGKTATTMNLGAGLSREGYDVLLVDLDAQANLTMAAGYQNPDELEYTVSDVLRNAAEEELANPAAGILKGPDGVELLPANIQLSMQEPALINVYGREALLAQFIDAVQMEYDYILIDCAPSLNILTINALAAADSVLIPTQPQYFSMQGLQMLLQTADKVRRKMNPELKVEGILVTMMDSRPRFTKELVDQLRSAYGNTIRIFDTEIPTSIRMAESASLGQSIYEYDPKGKLAKAYEQLTKEVMAHERKIQRNEHSLQADR